METGTLTRAIQVTIDEATEVSRWQIPVAVQIRKTDRQGYVVVVPCPRRNANFSRPWLSLTGNWDLDETASPLTMPKDWCARHLRSIVNPSVL